MHNHSLKPICSLFIKWTGILVVGNGSLLLSCSLFSYSFVASVAWHLQSQLGGIPSRKVLVYKHRPATFLLNQLWHSKRPTITLCNSRHLVVTHLLKLLFHVVSLYENTSLISQVLPILAVYNFNRWLTSRKVSKKLHLKPKFDCSSTLRWSVLSRYFQRAHRWGVRTVRITQWIISVILYLVTSLDRSSSPNDPITNPNYTLHPPKTAHRIVSDCFRLKIVSRQGPRLKTHI